MNAWNREQIEGEPLLESCDFCNALIVNWETLTNCWVTFDNRIICKNCKKAVDFPAEILQDISTMIEITRNPFTKLSLLSNFWIEDDMVFHILIPYNTEQIELLTDNEIGQYMGGN